MTDTKTTTSGRQSYHHGDLQQSLLQAATEMIAEGGTESLSMRKLADRVGVSRTAPYHHFKDKNELLCAIAEQGFRRQESILNRAREASGTESLQAVFRQYVLTYIESSHQHREQYDLMFGREIWRNGQPTASLQQLSKESFQNWLNWVTELQQVGLLRGENPLRTAQITWATLHGLCRLLNDGIYTEDSHLQQMCDSAIAMMLN